MAAHEIIKKYKDAIIERWLDEVIAELPASSNKKRPVVKDDIPELLNQLINKLAYGQDDVSNFNELHGVLRAKQENYSLVDVLREYRLLKRVVIRWVDLKEVLTIESRNLILDFFDNATEKAAQSFFEEKNQVQVKARIEAESRVGKLESDNDLRTHFIEGLTHDLKNPLTNMKLALEYLEASEQFKERKLLHLITKNMAKTEILVNSLLNIQLVNAGASFPIKIASCDLVDALSSLVNDNRLGEYVNVNYDFVENNIQGYWDEQAIRRAVDNLVQNAIRYGDSQKPITVSARRYDDITHISVHNYGRAIPFEEQVKIFTRLYQVDGKNGGSGLGLYLVKEIAEAHYGKVQLESSEEAGTTFIISMPNDIRQYAERNNVIS